MICHIYTHCFRSRFSKVAALALLVSGLAAAQSLSIYSGNGQLTLSEFKSSEPLVVQATGSSGQPLAGVTVNFAVSTGEGTVSVSSATTDSNGLAGTFATGFASDQINSEFPLTITASAGSSSVNFFFTIVPNAGNLSIQALTPTNNQTFTAASGTTIPAVAQTQILVQGGFVSGTGIPNVGLTVVSYPDSTVPAPAACSAPGGTVLTDSNGNATCNLTVNGTVGTTQLQVLIGGTYLGPIFNLTITAGAACTYSLSASSQSFTASAGTGSVNVITTSACAWTASSNANFIGITSGSSGTGNGTVSYNVAANTTGPSRSGTLTIAGKAYTVNQSAPNAPSGPTITTTSLPAGNVGVPYNSTLTASGGQPSYIWSISGSLPSGLSFVPSTGVISGTPQSQGVYGFTATVTDSANASASQNFSITINGTSGGSFSITNVSFANGVVGQSYSQPLTAANFCTTPFDQTPSFALASGALPGGLKIATNASGSQSIAGTPTAIGAFQFTLQATDACGHVATMSFTISVSATGTASQQMTVSMSSLSFMAQIGSAAPAAQSFHIAASSGTLSYTIAVASSGGNWLVAQSSTSGSTPASFSVAVANFANLTPGPYNGSITIASGASNGPVVIPVTLTVIAGPTLVLQSPTSITVSQAASPNQNDTPVTQEQIVLASGATPVHFTVAASTSDGNRWLIALPASGSTPSTLTASIDTGGLAVGKYTGTVTITPASGAPITVNITVNVTQNFPAPSSVVSGASFLAGPVSPGEIITIFGASLGPITPATLQLNASGEVATSLAGTQVFFDATPAPMIYSSPTQISVIVPYGIAGQTSTSVSVEYLTLKSSSITVPVATSAPGIFTLGGTSQGAILNQDSSVNGAAHPAAAGSVISIYATGEGQTSPAGVDGFVTQGPVAMPLLPVTVQINGEDAQVMYAGAAPGEPAGVLQVNAVIPSDVPHGTSVSVAFKVGTVSSQPGVTLVIAP